MSIDDFPLQVCRTKQGYTVEVPGLGIKKTGRHLAELEQEMRAALPELLALMAQHGLESYAVAGVAGGEVGRVVERRERKPKEVRVRTLEEKIQRGAMVALVMFVLSTPAVMAVNYAKNWKPDLESMKADLKIMTPNLETITSDLESMTPNLEAITPNLDTVTPDLEHMTPNVDAIIPNLSISDAIADRPWAIISSNAIKKTADIIESIQPDRKAEVVYNLGRIGVALEPYAAQMRPIWLACCATNAQLKEEASKATQPPPKKK